MSDSNHPFVMFPIRIWNLPGITIQLLKFYEKIFQFWHNGRDCFLNNKSLMQYAGMKSDSTVRDAFTYFESHGEMKRITKNGKRYILPPEPKVAIEDDNIQEDTPSAAALYPQRHSAAPPSATATHNNINIIKQINKSFCHMDEKRAKEKEPKKIENEKRHDWAEKKSGFADVTKQTTSYNPNSPGRQVRVSPLLEQYEKSMPTRISDLICKNPLQINT